MASCLKKREREILTWLAGGTATFQNIKKKKPRRKETFLGLW